MSKDDYIKIVCNAVKKQKLTYDAYRPAGEEDGWMYFRVLHQAYIGKGYKLGLPVYVAINKDGDYKIVSDYEAGNRALKREYELAKASPNGDTIQRLPIE